MDSRLLLDRLAQQPDGPRARDLTARIARAEQAIHRPVRVVFAGEFSSGKSTLVNTLCGSDVMETKVTASRVPAVVVRHAVQRSVRLILPDGSKESLHGSLDRVVRAQSARRIEVSLDRDVLRRFTILDTPGTSDPRRTQDEILELEQHADMFVWCTNGAQAWRDSERQVWTRLSQSTGKPGILAVTHVDMPRVRAGLARLMQRMTREAGPHFSDIVPISTLDAASALGPNGEVADPAVWAASGIEALIAAMDRLAERHRGVRRDRVRRLLDTQLEAAVTKLEAAEPVIEEDAPLDHLTKAWCAELSRFADALTDDAIATDDIAPQAAALLRTFAEAQIAPRRAALSGEGAALFQSFGQAADVVEALGRSNRPDRVDTAIDILAQLARDAINIGRREAR